MRSDTRAKVPRVLALFDQGTSMEQIADTMKMSRHTIRKIMAEHGRKARLGGRPRNSGRLLTVYSPGLEALEWLDAEAERLNVSRAVLGKALLSDAIAEARNEHR